MKEVVLFVLIGIVFGRSQSFDSKNVNTLTVVTGGKNVDHRMKDCYLYDIDYLEVTRCNISNEDGKAVPHGTNCTFRQLSEVDKLEEGLGKLIETVEQRICNDGHWSGTDFSVGHPLNRQKRFWGWFVAVAGFIACIVLCGSQSESPVEHHTPKFESPCKPREIQDNYYVAADRSVVVSWTKPKASDDNGDQPTVYQSDGLKSGGYFRGSTHGRTYYITYTAEDDTNQKAYCHFSFTVTESTCDSLQWPSDGRHDCRDTRVGRQCKFTCYNGYELDGDEHLTCENVQAPTWSSDVPTCEKVTCKSAPTPPANGTVHCKDHTYSFMSYCIIKCDDGFFLQGNPFTQCQEDRTWSNNEPTSCIDKTPPSLKCKKLQIFYADRGASSTTVTWEIPTATDPTDPAPDVIQTAGPTIGDVISVGSEYVEYKAIDFDNKSSECSIELRVQEIICVDPSYTFHDKNLKFTCSGGARHTYGVECNATCSDASFFPLNGTGLITCEDKGEAIGKWEVAGNDTDPYCKEISCPELEPPINGILVYDEILTRPVYTMMCNDQYDIPFMDRHFIGMFFCLDGNGWKPTNQVPDCTEVINPSRLQLPVLLYYYEGDCDTNETIADIKEQFQTILNKYIRPHYGTLCPVSETCTAENVVIRCGDIQHGRKKRSTNPTIDTKRSVENVTRKKRQAESASLIVELDIVVTVTLSDEETILSHIDYYDDIVASLSSAMQDLLNNGSLDIQNFTTQNDSWDAPNYADIFCDSGYVLDGDICKPCPPGYYLNETTTTCDQCPIGQFSPAEGSIDCISCLPGYSTRQTGSKSQNNCTELCGPGTISPDGMMPCSTCLYGEYQGDVGQTTCIQCPRGSTTQATTSTSVEDCQNFDIRIEDTSGNISLASIPSGMNNVTLMFWTSRANEESMATTIQLKSDGDDRCILYLTNNFRVQVPNQIDETIVELRSDTWTHQAVVWNIADSSLDVYIDGSRKFRSTLPINSSLITDGELTMTANGPSGIHMTGFYLFDRVLTSSEIATHASSCHVTTNDGVIDIEVFHNKGGNGISIIAPSNCDAVDNCQPDPCNGHKCVDGHDIFTCYCNSGWSGNTCSIPPDYCLDNQCTNGATCQSGAYNYTCDCLQGYSGRMCEIAPVDGGWSEWVITSACTQICGTGRQTRKRACDSPVPDLQGADCDGDDEDTIPCNTEACRVCEDLPTPSGTLTSCMTNMTTGIRTCQLYCEDDKIMPSGLPDYQDYECGPHTNYEWEQAEVLPACVEPSAPTHLEITTSIEYSTNISDADVVLLTDSVLDNFQSTPCANNCQASVHLSDNGTKLTLSYSIDLSLEPELHIAEYVANGTVSESLQELVDAVNYLELSAQHIQNNTVEIFNAVVHGVPYTVDTSSLTNEGAVTCPDGQVVYEGACLQCPAGTYSNGDYCSYCELGTYQPSSGQSECIQCPSTLTSKTIGSKDLSNCSESLTTSTFTTTSPTPTEPSLQCPAGTYSNGDYCSYCELGTYQPSSGQSECIQCPSTLTTKAIGSKDLSNCSESLTTSTFTTTSPTSTEPSSNTTVILIVVISIVVVVILSLTFALVWYKECRSNKNKYVLRSSKRSQIPAKALEMVYDNGDDIKASDSTPTTQCELFLASKETQCSGSDEERNTPFPSNGGCETAISQVIRSHTPACDEIG